MDLTTDVERGRRAAELLNDELLKSALDAIESEVIQQWENCPVRDTDGKETLWKLYKVSKKFRAVLQGHVENGKLAAHELSRLNERRGLSNLFRAA